MRYFIVDDDRASRIMLSQIINSTLGTVNDTTGFCAN